jgi:hypothetical protein
VVCTRFTSSTNCDAPMSESVRDGQEMMPWTLLMSKPVRVTYRTGAS